MPKSELKLVHASVPPLTVSTVAPSAGSLSTCEFASDMVCWLHILLPAAQTASQLSPAEPMIHGTGSGGDGGVDGESGVATTSPRSSHGSSSRVAMRLGARFVGRSYVPSAEVMAKNTIAQVAVVGSGVCDGLAVCIHGLAGGYLR